MCDRAITNKPQKCLKSIDKTLLSDHDTTLPSKFAILHMVGGVANSTKKKNKQQNLCLQEYDRKHQPRNGHIKHEAVTGSFKLTSGRQQDESNNTLLPFIFQTSTEVQLVFFFCSGVSRLFGAQGSPSSGSLLSL